MSPNSLPVAVVAGGGPAGALCAKVLCEQGFAVQLYEAYPHPNDAECKEEKSKAYVISIGRRGQLALKRCGVDPVRDLEGAVVSEAVVRHNVRKDKSLVIIPKEGHQAVVIRRRALAGSLLLAAEKAGAEIHCGWGLKDVDFDKKEVTLADKSNNVKEQKVKYDLLVGADGAKSATRTLLSNHLTRIGEEFHVKTLDDTMEYQVGVLPRPWKEIIHPEKATAAPLDSCPPASVHQWADTIRGSTALAFPISDSNNSAPSKFLVCVIFPEGKLGEMKASGFAGYTEALGDLFKDWTSDSRLELAQLLAQEDNNPNIGGTCVWSDALSHPKSGVVLMGDAGHGMWPSLGQGCNAALESVSVFADAIDAVKGSVSNGTGCRNIDFSESSHQELVEAIALEFDGLRSEDAKAAVDLTYGGIGGTKVRGANHSPLIFKLQVTLFLLLNKISAGFVPNPALFRIMKGDEARYSTLKMMNKMERIITYGVVLSLPVLIAIKFV